MINKAVLDQARVRRVPKQFSWIDHKLVQDGYVKRCNVTSLALYLFLVTVCDAQGLSYYSDPKIAENLAIEINALYAARESLIQQGMIAYQKPLYQVLALDVATALIKPKPQEALLSQGGEMRTLAEVFETLRNRKKV
ncbi:MAG: hypothetical protein WCQ41_10415 [Bacillota bacterium]